MIETSWLRAIASFAEDANLSRTARRLHLSQPAVHAQLRRLSEALGVALYRRVGRGLVLTPEGIEAAAFARAMDERMGDFAAHVAGRLRERHLVLAAGAGALLYILHDALHAFSRGGSPRLELVTADAATAFEAVRSGAAHVGVAASESTPDALRAHHLTTVPPVVVLPRAHPLARRRRISLAELDGQRLVVPPEGRPHRVMLDAALRAAGARVTIGATARGWELSMALVSMGFGLTIVNGCCRVPRGLVARPVVALPPVHYVVFTRPSPPEDAAALVRTLIAHGDAWRHGAAA